MVIRLTVSGRARQSCVDATHEVGWVVSYLLQSKGNNERNIAVLKQELMACGYQRHIVRSDGEAAMVSHVRLAILATVADGPHDLIQEQTSKGQPPGTGLAEGTVKEVKSKVRTLQFKLERGLSRPVPENPHSAHALKVPNRVFIASFPVFQNRKLRQSVRQIVIWIPRANS